MHRLREVEQQLILQCLDVEDYVTLAQACHAWGKAARHVHSATHLCVTLHERTLKNSFWKEFLRWRMMQLQPGRILSHAFYQLKATIEPCYCTNKECLIRRLIQLLSDHPTRLSRLDIDCTYYPNLWSNIEAKISKQPSHTLLQSFQLPRAFTSLTQVEIEVPIMHWQIHTTLDVFESMPMVRQMKFTLKRNEYRNTELEYNQINWWRIKQQLSKLSPAIESFTLTLTSPRYRVDMMTEPGLVPTLPRLTNAEFNFLHNSDTIQPQPALKELRIPLILNEDIPCLKNIALYPSLETICSLYPAHLRIYRRGSIPLHDLVFHLEKLLHILRDAPKIRCLEIYINSSEAASRGYTPPRAMIEAHQRLKQHTLEPLGILRFRVIGSYHGYWHTTSKKQFAVLCPHIRSAFSPQAQAKVEIVRDEN